MSEILQYLGFITGREKRVLGFPITMVPTPGAVACRVSTFVVKYLAEMISMMTSSIDKNSHLGIESEK